MTENSSQQQLWNSIHAEGKHEVYSQAPTEFAREVIRLFPPHANVVELGCGFGADSAFFAQQGHSVIATDFSEVAIARNKKHYRDIPDLAFQVVDMSNRLPFQDGEFDAVYARLSLHYFPDEGTRQIFHDIQRVLKPGGWLAFMCKSTDDPLYGKGRQLEKDMFDTGGHRRHFFSEEYAKNCLANGYHIEQLQYGRDDLYGQPSAYLQVIAQKPLPP